MLKYVFESEAPERIVRELPAETLYLAIKQKGLRGCVELVDMATIEQCRILIDFDCWDRDRFHEENFWEWLALTDENDDLTILQKLIKCFDLRIVSLLISRYVVTEAFEEPTENPPGPEYYTPDKGFTWIRVIVEDTTKQFLLARLLALLFETNADLFYQLLGIRNVATDSMLEEEAYQDRNKRLSGEGIPDPEYAARLNSPLPLPQAIALLAGSSRPRIDDIPVIEPLLYDGGQTPPIIELFNELPHHDEFEAEFTLIMNGAIVFFESEFFDSEKTATLIEKVKGALSIGIVLLREATDTPAKELYERIGLQGLYRAGLWRLYQLRSIARGVPPEIARVAHGDSALFSVLAGAREIIPEVPVWFNHRETIPSENTEKLEPGYRPIVSLEEVLAVEERINGL